MTLDITAIAIPETGSGTALGPQSKAMKPAGYQSPQSSRPEAEVRQCACAASPAPGSTAPFLSVTLLQKASWTIILL